MHIAILSHDLVIWPSSACKPHHCVSLSHSFGHPFLWDRHLAKLDMQAHHCSKSVRETILYAKLPTLIDRFIASDLGCTQAHQMTIRSGLHTSPPTDERESQLALYIL